MSRMHSDKGLIAGGLLLLFLVALTVYANGRRYVEVVFSAHSDAPARLQIFHGRGAHSESRSQWFVLDADVAAHSLRLSGSDAARLRVDPPAASTTILCGLRVGQSGQPSQFDVLDSRSVRVAHEEGCLRMSPEPAARDPQVLVQFSGAAARKIARADRWQSVFFPSLVAAAMLLSWLAFSIRASWFSRLARIPMIPGVPWLERRLPWVGGVLMLALGIGHVFITPPGAVADEEAHLAKVVRIANGSPFGDSGSKVLPSTRQMYGPFSDFLTTKEPFTGDQLRKQLRRPVECVASTTALARGANGYFPHQYLLPTLVYKTACATGAPFGAFLYLARLLNLLLATALVTWGLSHARLGRWGLWLVALLPMSLSQMSSLSADSLALSLSLAWLGLVSGIAAGSMPPARAAPALYVLALVIALLKPGSAWILASLLFCKPAYDAASASFAAALAKFVAMPWLVHLLWTLMASGEAQPLAGVDPSAQVRSLMTNPLHFLGAVANTYLTDHAIVLLQRMVGVLGWLDVRLSPWAYWVGSAALVAALWTREDRPDPFPTACYVAPLALLLAVASTAVIALPLFLYWTQTGAQVVSGLQGRYFLVTAAFVLVWCAMRVPPAVRSVLVGLLVLSVVAINIDALHHLYVAYYVSGRP